VEVLCLRVDREDVGEQPIQGSGDVAGGVGTEVGGRGERRRHAVRFESLGHLWTPFEFQMHCARLDRTDVSAVKADWCVRRDQVATSFSFASTMIHKCEHRGLAGSAAPAAQRDPPPAAFCGR
jgi:hypothetical protein